VSDNLYTPPQADLEVPTSAPGGSGDFDIGRCLSEGWAATWRNFPLWLGAGIVMTLASIASVITLIGIVLALPVLYWGGFYFTLRMHDGGAALKDLFAGFSRFGAALLGMLAFILLTIVLGLPANVLVQAGMNASPPNFGLVALGYLVSFAIAALVTLRLLFAPFLMVDRGLRFGPALSEAWQRTRALKLKIVLLSLTVGAVTLAGVLALIVGVIPALVMGFLMWASAYRQIFGGAPQPAA
jgi:hypothetical protein